MITAFRLPSNDWCGIFFKFMFGLAEYPKAARCVRERETNRLTEDKGQQRMSFRSYSLIFYSVVTTWWYKTSFSLPILLETSDSEQVRSPHPSTIKKTTNNNKNTHTHSYARFPAATRYSRTRIIHQRRRTDSKQKGRVRAKSSVEGFGASSETETEPKTELKCKREA